ncbi:MAG TPA: hypothetical protein VJ986_07300 [Gaiellaceae bacterium]|nr:hypothetical protein [Gaiellaceae bacterium]
MHRFLSGCLLGLLLGAAGLLAAAPAGAKTVPGQPPFRVLVLDHLNRAQFDQLARRGAVGLLVPGVGPTTNRRQSLAELVRGAEVNARMGGVPSGPRLVDPMHATGTPTGPDVVAVVLPPKGAPVENNHRYRIAVIGHGFHGLLQSKTTHIAGLVSIVDIAPTALGHSRGTLGSVESAHPLAALSTLDRQIHANNRLKFAAVFVVAGAVALLALLGLRAAVTAVPASLLVSTAIGAAQLTNEVAIMAALTVGTLGGALLLARVCRTDRGLLVLYAVVLGLYLLMLARRPDWVAISPLGPTQNQRFWGIGNQLETLLLGPVLAGAALARRRFGAAGFAVFALVALVTVASNRLGADGGGAIVLGVAFAFLGSRMLRLGRGGFTTLLLVAATIVLAIVSYDLRSPGPNHLRSAFSHGVSGLVAVAVNRVPLAYRPALAHWPLVVPLGIAFALALALALRGESLRLRRDLVLAVAAGVGTSLLVNDSAAYVLAGGVAVIASFARFAPAYAPQVVLPTTVRALDAQPMRSEARGE